MITRTPQQAEFDLQRAHTVAYYAHRHWIQAGTPEARESLTEAVGNVEQAMQAVRVAEEIAQLTGETAS